MHSNTTGTTLARIEAIRGFWEPGMTAREIASLLSKREGREVSRMAVIGIYNRNRGELVGFPLPPSGRDMVSTKLAKAPVARKPRAARPKLAPKPKPVPVSNVLPFRLPVKAFEYVATHPTKPLYQLEARECRWPMSGTGVDTRFCSQHAEGSYCEHHRLMSIGQGSRGERSAEKTLKRYG